MLVREATVAVVDEDLCGGCALCVLSCPYKAVSFDAEKRRAVVNELLCHGCGTCVAMCPSAAIAAKGFTDAQLTAEVRGLHDAGSRCTR
ncbi:MAG: 4Fe-4S dicluster domain-containing protein [Actinobacteria bacterium]|nr:MAG: 4Fe-4S dicluster domain-containing protein [Actinomycetota bacterium]